MEEDGRIPTVPSEPISDVIEATKEVGEENRGSASSPANGIAKEPKAKTHEAAKNPNMEWFISIFSKDHPQVHLEAGSKHLIQKVPDRIRHYGKDKKYFDPRVVSLGPYHHHVNDLKPMEMHKITAARRFVDESTSEEDKTKFYEKVMKVIGNAKRCYAAEAVANLTDDDFARMMFLDGCFVLYFILGMNEGDINLEVSNDLVPLIVWDMFLIENQLPFEVLDALMSSRFGSSSKNVKKEIEEFIRWEVLRPMGMYLNDSSRSLDWYREDDQGVHNAPLHLLDVLRTILLDFPPSDWAEKNSNRPRNFGSVMELKDAGIRFGRSHRQCLMGIRFKENILFPRLLLPRIIINDATVSHLLNLTAFEVCSEKHSGSGVTSYIRFMNSLINDGADVKKLGSKGILHHALGSNEEVARLFNEWPVEVMNDLELYNYVSFRIRRHRNRRVRISIAGWLNRNFRSPWTAISLVAAVLLLLLTFTQTYFAAFPRR